MIERLEQLSAIFTIDICAYAVMSYHIIVGRHLCRHLHEHPGSSLAREIELLVAVALSEYQALAAATGVMQRQFRSVLQRERLAPCAHVDSEPAAFQTRA